MLSGLGSRYMLLLNTRAPSALRAFPSVCNALRELVCTIRRDRIMSNGVVIAAGLGFRVQGSGFRVSGLERTCPRAL